MRTVWHENFIDKNTSPHQISVAALFQNCFKSSCNCRLPYPDPRWAPQRRSSPSARWAPRTRRLQPWSDPSNHHQREHTPESGPRTHQVGSMRDVASSHFSWKTETQLAFRLIAWAHLTSQPGLSGWNGAWHGKTSTCVTSLPSSRTLKFVSTYRSQTDSAPSPSCTFFFFYHGFKDWFRPCRQKFRCAKIAFY